METDEQVAQQIIPENDVSEDERSNDGGKKKRKRDEEENEGERLQLISDICIVAERHRDIELRDGVSTIPGLEEADIETLKCIYKNLKFDVSSKKGNPDAVLALTVGTAPFEPKNVGFAERCLQDDELKSDIHYAITSVFGEFGIFANIVSRITGHYLEAWKANYNRYLASGLADASTTEANCGNQEKQGTKDATTTNTSPGERSS